MMYSSYLWSVNRRPFGTGQFWEQKKRFLNVFVSTHSVDSPLWAKYGRLIADDMGLAFDTEVDKERVWAVVEALGTFRQAGEVPKLGRWFSVATN